jgi:site-specific DNA-methyltransferase (adenine-specific)
MKIAEQLNKIHHADCIEFMRNIPDESIDMIITDPPYKVSQMYGGGVDADNLTAVSSILRSIPEMARVLKPGRFAVIFYDNRILPYLFEATKGTELVYRKQLYLYRRWGSANRWMGWMQTTDPICMFIKGHSEPFQAKVKGKVHHDVYIKKGPEADSTGHPAQKPLDVIKDIIFWCSNEKDIVLDPYIGSGTTAVACEQLNRFYIGIDSNLEYCKLSENRRTKHSGVLKLDSFNSEVSP